jgi:uncharacterized membrane protein
MIDVSPNPDHPDFEIVELRSNLSISLDRLFFVFLGLSTITLLVAIGPLIVGLWPVMVVAILHLVAVGLCLRLAWRGHWAREQILIGPETLEFHRFLSDNEQRGQFPLAWVRVVVETGRFGDRRIYLACQGQRQEMGAFLPVDERLEAAKEMNERIRPLSAWSHKNLEQVS